MILFHGSDIQLKKPFFGGGKITNDYGPGFYCTESRVLACEWAVAQDHDGFANEYEFNPQGLKVLDLNSEGCTILHWLALLLQNRTFDTRYGIATLAKDYLVENFSLPTEQYDVIRGYRADDSYFSFAQDFISGAISYPQLTTAIRLGNLGEQIVLKSRRSFGRITFRAAHRAVREKWLESKLLRDTTARHDYFDLRKTPYRLEDLSIQKIMAERIVPGDPRL